MLDEASRLLTGCATDGIRGVKLRGARMRPRTGAGSMRDLISSGVRIACRLIAALLTAGCATTTYKSERPAAMVADCIASGWRKVPSSGAELPVSLTKTNDTYFVDVVLVRDFPTFLPLHSIWAKVRAASVAGSTGSTEYRRNFQIAHARIDRVVKECQ